MESIPSNQTGGVKPQDAKPTGTAGQSSEVSRKASKPATKQPEKAKITARSVVLVDGRSITLVQRGTIDGTPITLDKTKVVVNLETLEEPIFQIVLKAIKLAVNHSNGNDVSHSTVVKDKSGADMKVESQVAVIQRLISAIVPKSVTEDGEPKGNLPKPKM